jgi:hypothetical protein
MTTGEAIDASLAETLRSVLPPEVAEKIRTKLHLFEYMTLRCKYLYLFKNPLSKYKYSETSST